MICLFPHDRALQDHLKIQKFGKVKMPGATASLRGIKYYPIPIHDSITFQVKAEELFQ